MDKVTNDYRLRAMSHKGSAPLLLSRYMTETYKTKLGTVLCRQ